LPPLWEPPEARSAGIRSVRVGPTAKGAASKSVNEGRALAPDPGCSDVTSWRGDHPPAPSLAPASGSWILVLRPTPHLRTGILNLRWHGAARLQSALRRAIAAAADAERRIRDGELDMGVDGLIRHPLLLGVIIDIEQSLRPQLSAACVPPISGRGRDMAISLSGPSAAWEPTRYERPPAVSPRVPCRCIQSPDGLPRRRRTASSVQLRRSRSLPPASSWPEVPAGGSKIASETGIHFSRRHC
jgi:hypothetical protein